MAAHSAPKPKSTFAVVCSNTRLTRLSTCLSPLNVCLSSIVCRQPPGRGVPVAWRDGLGWLAAAFSGFMPLLCSCCATTGTASYHVRDVIDFLTDVLCGLLNAVVLDTRFWILVRSGIHLTLDADGLRLQQRRCRGTRLVHACLVPTFRLECQGGDGVPKDLCRPRGSFYRLLRRCCCTNCHFAVAGGIVADATTHRSRPNGTFRAKVVLY